MTEIKTIKDFMILPPKPGTCSICGSEHESHFPHNALSLYYQYRFYIKHERFPTWDDACAHVSTDVLDLFKIYLISHNGEFTKTENPIAETYKVQK